MLGGGGVERLQGEINCAEGEGEAGSTCGYALAATSLLPPLHMILR